MKNLFIVKRITENKDISDEAFAVWCGLRNIIQKDVKEYFVSYNMIAYSVFNRVPNRYEYEAIKKGYKELKEKEYIKEILEFSKTEHTVDLSALYFETGQEYFSDLSMEEMHKIMSIDCGKHSKYKLLRYFTCMVGTFNRSGGISDEYRGKIGGMSLDYFTELIPITKPTVISFNELLEKNKLLFIIRHKDFLQGINAKGQSEIREIPNTYSRWEDRVLAQVFAQEIHGYQYLEEQKDTKTKQANINRGLAQKYNSFCKGKKYDAETIKDIYDYCINWNDAAKKAHYVEIGKGFDHELVLKDMSVFDDYLADMYLSN